MANAQTVLKGVVRGKLIELEHEPGLPDGQQVTVALQPVLPPGEGIRQSAGDLGRCRPRARGLAGRNATEPAAGPSGDSLMYVLDTDICSAHLRKVAIVTNRFQQHVGQLHLSVLTLGELLSWTLRAKSPPKYHQGLLKLLSDVTVLEVDQNAAWKFGEVRAQLLDLGQPVAAVDLMIAATALVFRFTLVTHNTQHFLKVPGLTVEDWLVP